MSYGSGSVDGRTLTGLIQVRGSFAAPSTGPVSRRGAHVPGRVPARRAEPDLQVASEGGRKTPSAAQQPLQLLVSV